MRTTIEMGVLGIYIYNADRKAWYAGEKGGIPQWGTFEQGKEWPEGGEREAEETREIISGDEVTYTVALLQ
jgi:hypothetical protein